MNAADPIDGLHWRLPPCRAPLMHGGALAVPHDFSTNTHPAGPLPAVARAVRAAARDRYPPSDDAALRAALGRLHGVDAARVVLLPSASAGLHLLARAAADWAGLAEASWPTPGYGEYAAAAAAAGLRRVAHDADGDATAGPRLRLQAEPSSPHGRADTAALAALLAARRPDLVVLDLAYQALRLDGDAAAEAAMVAGTGDLARWLARGLPPAVDRAWQLWSPNKACGLTGVRGAYLLAPADARAEAVAAALRATQPSWPLGADGRAMLGAWAEPATQRALAAGLARLRRWRADLARTLRRAGWTVEPGGVSPFLVARPPDDRPWDAARAQAAGVALRATDSLGLPGAFRLCARPPRSLRALAAALAPPRVLPPWPIEPTPVVSASIDEAAADPPSFVRPVAAARA